MSAALGRRDVQAGLLFVLFGALALGLGPAEKGTASEMASGYFPALLGVLLIAVGLMLVAYGVRAVRLGAAPASGGVTVHPGDASIAERSMRPGRAFEARAALASDRASAQTPLLAASRLSRLRPFLILPAIVAFALLLESAGLVIASVALLVIGALAARDLTVRQFAVLAVVLLVLVLAVFVWGLGLPVKVWPSSGAAG